MQTEIKCYTGKQQEWLLNTAQRMKDDRRYKIETIISRMSKVNGIRSKRNGKGKKD